MGMRIFKTNWFAHFAKKEQIGDRKLSEIVTELEEQQFEADLGGGVIKKRLARPGQGKSGGFRLIICFRSESRTLFIYAYAKSDQSDIGPSDLKTFRAAAHHLFALTDRELDQAVAAGRLLELGAFNDQEL
jgi:hypothetical protein